MERRAGAKGNTHQQSTYWAQNQARVSKALERIGQLLPSHTRGGSRVRESRTHGSGRGACDETHVPTATTPRVHHAARRRGSMADGGAVVAPAFGREESLVANANSGPSPYALVVVPNRFPPSPVATGWRNDIDRCRGVIPRLCNGGTEQGSCGQSADNARGNLPIFCSGWARPGNQCSRTNRQQEC